MATLKEKKLAQAVGDLLTLNLDMCGIVEALAQGYPESAIRELALTQLAAFRAHAVQADELFRSMA